MHIFLPAHYFVVSVFFFSPKGKFISLLLWANKMCLWCNDIIS